MIQARQRLTLLYGATIFLGAFLLFQVQPMVGKMVLPWFGGSAAVWTTCMLFFQALLFLAYLYGHLLVRFVPPPAQGPLHLVLLAAGLAALPLGLDAAGRPTGGADPALGILAVLLTSVGLPYFALASTGPLLQAWFARERPTRLPYRLFALSNLGSLLALLAYPAAVEPLLPLARQAALWSAGFAGFAALCGVIAWRSRRQAAAPPRSSATAPPPFAARLGWLVLAACPSILLLADTGYLTENIAPVPLLWVLPLSLYLISFVLCFDRPGWYRRRLFLPLSALSLATLAYLPTLRVSALPLLPATAANLASFFVVCMACHGELARRRPSPSHLTGYYLMLAAGGTAGGLFVGALAPYCFAGNYEFSVGLVLAALAISAAALAGRAWRRPALRLAGWGGAAALAAALGWVRLEDHAGKLANARVSARDFYGSLRVTAGGQGIDAYRSLLHGQIVHGRQFTAPERQDWPITYYGPASGAGIALASLGGEGPLRVGIVGVGAGTLASYGRPGDYFRFYDIDPLVLRLARSQFTYLARSRARAEVVLGDARLAMATEAPQGFDLLLLDAFSGDAIPVHLLTREAFAVYFRQLKPQGVLAVHVSNRFLDLAPVVKAAAVSSGRLACAVESPRDDARQIFPATWVLVGDAAFFARPGIAADCREIAAPTAAQAWRDDYSSVLAVLK